MAVRALHRLKVPPRTLPVHHRALQLLGGREMDVNNTRLHIHCMYILDVYMLKLNVEHVEHFILA